MKKRLGIGLVAAVFLGVMTSGAQAGYSIQVITGAFDTGQIDFTSPLAAPGSTAGTVNVDVAALNAFLTGSGFSFNSLGGSSNALTPGLEAQLTQLGEVVRSDGAGTGTITIIATEDGFNFPVGTPKSMTSAATDAFLNFSNTDQRTFQSTFTDANGSNSTPLQLFAASTSSSATTAPSVFAGLDSYTLTNTTVITLGSTSASDRFAGTTRVRSVPEPASLALMLMGGGLALVLRRRNRKV